MYLFKCLYSPNKREKASVRMAKIHAEESEKTKKIRKKLLFRLKELDKKITQQALKRKSLEIHRWITRHTFDRMILPTPSNPLFDENQNTAKLSPKTYALIEQLKNLAS